MFHWANTQKGRDTYIKILKENKILNKIERERLKLIQDVKVDQIVTIIRYNREENEKVIRIYSKIYKISLGNNDYVLINKESLSGYPNSIIKECTGDGRRYIGEKIKLILLKDKE